MLARFILVLLLAAFAFPASAPAACHDAAMTNMTHSMAMPMDAAPMQASDLPDHKATPPHGCIGCVPPSNWSAARILGAVPHGAVVMIERAAVLDLGGPVAPDLRPPRLA